jgi:hypothetical protein
MRYRDAKNSRSKRRSVISRRIDNRYLPQAVSDVTGFTHRFLLHEYRVREESRPVFAATGLSRPEGANDVGLVETSRRKHHDWR